MASGAPHGAHRVISGAGYNLSGESGCVTQRGTPTPAADMQAASRLMLTAAVMQPLLQKGVFPPAHQLTHFAGKLLPNSQSSQSAGPGQPPWPSGSGLLLWSTGLQTTSVHVWTGNHIVSCVQSQGSKNKDFLFLNQINTQ